MLEAILMKPPGGIVKSGQIQWTTPGTYQWTCPDGVTEVCCVIIAAGANGYYQSSVYYGGYGGGLRYRNKIPVVPGQVYTILVGTPSQGNAAVALQSSAFDMFVGAYNIGTAIGGDILGGWGGSAGNSVNYSSGGNAGTYTNGASNGSSTASTSGRGTTLVGNLGPGGTSQGGGLHGGGGGYRISTGGNGGVRIIWGGDRAYPTTKVTNV